MADPRRAWLADALDGFVPDEPTEASFLVGFEELLGLPGDVFDASHFSPGHVTASGFVVSPDAGSLLLIHHAKLDKWLQPGGHVEAEDASLEAAARRELAEEVGLVALENPELLDIDIHDLPARGDLPGHLHFDVRFAFFSRHDVIEALDGVLDARWVPFSQIAEFTEELSITRPAAKLRRLLG